MEGLQNGLGWLEAGNDFLRFAKKDGCAHVSYNQIIDEFGVNLSGITSQNGLFIEKPI